MQGQWLVRENRDALLIFYNGWGMDARPFAAMQSQWVDVYMLYDYRDLTLPESLAKMAAVYSEVHVLAWSLGVWAAMKTSDAWPVLLTSATALNGTLQPIHSRFGIPPQVFDATLEQLTSETRLAFYRNMFSTEGEAETFLLQPPLRSLEEIRAELKHLHRSIMTESADPAGGFVQPFGRVVIGTHDRIIPAVAQRRFWQDHPACRRMDFGHFPFYSVPRWEEWLSYEPA